MKNTVRKWEMIKADDSLKGQGNKAVQMEEKQRSSTYLTADSEGKKQKEKILLIITMIQEKSLKLKDSHLHTEKTCHIHKKADLP